MADGAVFSLRLRDPRLRDLVREVARREGISQNELIEHAIEDEMIVRGRLLVTELQTAAERLAQLSGDAYASVVARSIRDFAAGEARPDPLSPVALHRDATGHGLTDAPQSPDLDRLGVLAAFDAGRR